jgi:hypothetical protein
VCVVVRIPRSAWGGMGQFSSCLSLGMRGELNEPLNLSLDLVLGTNVLRAVVSIGLG